MKRRGFVGSLLAGGAAFAMGDAAGRDTASAARALSEHRISLILEVQHGEGPPQGEETARVERASFDDDRLARPSAHEEVMHRLVHRAPRCLVAICVARLPDLRYHLSAHARLLTHFPNCCLSELFAGLNPPLGQTPPARTRAANQQHLRPVAPEPVHDSAG